MKSDIACDARL